MVKEALLLIILIICLYTDLKYKKIYNIVLVPAAVFALAINIYLGGLGGVVESLKGMLLGMALLFFPFLHGGIGAGDVKLLGVIGAFYGMNFVWLTFLAAALAGGLISILVMLKERNFIKRIKSVGYMLLWVFHIIPWKPELDSIESNTALTFPYGVAITCGTVMAYVLR